MSKTLTYKLCAVIAIFLCTMSAFLSAIVRPASSLALVSPESLNVALVPGQSGMAMNGGSLPTFGFPGGYSPTFTNLDPYQISNANISDPIVAGGYDTVVLVQITLIQNWLSDTIFKNRIYDFVFNGGKLIIWDSEVQNYTNDYSSFIYPFTENTPGPQGSNAGTVWITENNTLGTNDTTSMSYVNTAAISSGFDIGDANVMVTNSPDWCTHLVARNFNIVIGPVQTYARYGNGLIIWNGLDMDYMGGTIANDNNGDNNLNYIWFLQLKQPWNPDNLPCGIRTSGITVTPVQSTNPTGTTHTVTATIRDNLASPIPNVTVNFTIYAGPNAGLNGQSVTNAVGEAYFSWTSNLPGTDQVNATAQSPFNPLVSVFDDKASKTWIQTTIPVCIEIHPETLNLKSKGHWITCFIWIPAAYNVNDVDISSILLNSTIPAEPQSVSTGNNHLMVKFDRAAVETLIISQNITFGKVTLTVRLRLLDGTSFEGSDIIKARMPGDINCDRKVDMKDLAPAANAFGGHEGQPRWNSAADENEDGKIDCIDIATIARNFGTKY